MSALKHLSLDQEGLSLSNMNKQVAAMQLSLESIQTTLNHQELLLKKSRNNKSFGLESQALEDFKSSMVEGLKKAYATLRAFIAKIIAWVKNFFTSKTDEEKAARARKIFKEMKVDNPAGAKKIATEIHNYEDVIKKFQSTFLGKNIANQEVISNLNEICTELLNNIKENENSADHFMGTHISHQTAVFIQNPAKGIELINRLDQILPDEKAVASINSVVDEVSTFWNSVSTNKDAYSGFSKILQGHIEELEGVSEKIGDLGNQCYEYFNIDTTSITYNEVIKACDGLGKLDFVLGLKEKCDKRFFWYDFQLTNLEKSLTKTDPNTADFTANASRDVINRILSNQSRLVKIVYKLMMYSMNVNHFYRALNNVQRSLVEAKELKNHALRKAFRHEISKLPFDIQNKMTEWFNQHGYKIAGEKK